MTSAVIIADSLPVARALMLFVLLFIILAGAGVVILVFKYKNANNPENKFEAASQDLGQEKKVFKGETTTKVENIDEWEQEKDQIEDTSFPYAQGLDGIRNEDTPNLPPELTLSNKEPKKIVRKQEDASANTPNDDWNV